MKGIKVLAAALAAASIGAALLAANAEAELPEFGQCLEAAGGAFKNAGCTVASVPGEENFDWLEGAGGGFTGGAPTKTLPLTLETVGGEKVICGAAFDGGEYVGPKTVLIHLAFKGCATSGGTGTVSCQNDPVEKGKPPFTEPGLIGFAPLEGTLGFIKAGSKPKVGLDITAGGGPLTVFECGGEGSGEGPQTFLTGSVIAKIAPLEKMTVKFKWKFKQKLGKQKPEHLEGAPKDTLSVTAPFLSEAKGVVSAGLSLTLLNLNIGGEKLEIKALP